MQPSRSALAVDDRRPSPGDTTHSRLVLLVGAALRPDATTAQELQRDGLRTIWRDSTVEAVRTASLATFDAVCVDTTTLGAAAGGVIERLRAALPCPLLVVGSGADAREEIDALRSGADLYLARPLPTRRLCAHLLALLRRPAAAAMPASGPAAPSAPAASTLFDRLLDRVGPAAAVAELDGRLSLRASPGQDGVEVTLRGLQLRLR